MDKKSIIGLQKIDCNCNDCLYLIRDFVQYERSVEQHHTWQLDYFNAIKSNKLKRADEWLKFGEPEKATALINEANNMRFQFDKSKALIQYGQCEKLNKDVSFIPNTCQLETQECFKHRRS